jgi:hypothetical protein
MKYLVSALTIFLMTSSVAPHGYELRAPQGTPTDTTFRIAAEISGCGRSDSICVRVTGDHLENPLFWSLTVKDCDGTLLFYHSACTCDADEYFESEAYIRRQSYQGTKNDWFFHDLPERVITKRRFARESPIFDRNDDGAVYVVARNYLEEKYQLPSEKAKQLTEELALKMMKEEVVLLSVPRDPSDTSDPLIYVKEIRQFVPIGHW